jgi:hypothetical protein
MDLSDLDDRRHVREKRLYACMGEYNLRFLGRTPLRYDVLKPAAGLIRRTVDNNP